MPSGGADAPYGSAGRVDPAPPPVEPAVPGATDAAPTGPAAGWPGAGGEPLPEFPGAPVGDGAVRHGRPHRPHRPAQAFLGSGWRELLRAEGPCMVALIGAGLLVAVLWRLLAPAVTDSGNPLESAAAVDGTLAALGFLAGVTTAAAVLRRPGPLPTRRTLVVLVFTLLASILSWQVGDLLGDPDLRAKGVALVWPIITAGGLFVGSLLPGVSRRLET